MDDRGAALSASPAAGSCDAPRCRRNRWLPPAQMSGTRREIAGETGGKRGPNGARLVIDSPLPMPRVGAFFDVDRTIVSCNTARLFVRDLRSRGEISLLRTMRALFWMAKYHLSLIDLQWVASRLAGEMAGRLERDFADRCRGWVEKDVLPLVVPGAREK